jgi:plasmid stability protein
MPDFLIRDLDTVTMDALKKRAEKNGRSLQAEIKDALKRSVKMTKEESLASMRYWQEQSRGKDYGDSTAMIREDRDR